MTIDSPFNYDLEEKKNNVEKMRMSSLKTGRGDLLEFSTLKRQNIELNRYANRCAAAVQIMTMHILLTICMFFSGR